MASGKSLELREIKRPEPEVVSQGNQDHYHAKGRAYSPHVAVRAELGDRRRYRAIVRRERQEAEQVRNRAKLAQYGIDEIPSP
jgi:hypothetical protein